MWASKCLVTGPLFLYSSATPRCSFTHENPPIDHPISCKMDAIDIFECVKTGNQDVVKEWLAAGTDSYVVQADGQTLVHGAVAANQPAILELILRNVFILIFVRMDECS